jgi:CPA2 family monovalent cation:H+ antiporter-2
VRAAKPRLDIVARAHSDAEVEYLALLGADQVIMGEREIARAMVEYLEAHRSGEPDRRSSLPPFRP